MWHFFDTFKSFNFTWRSYGTLNHLSSGVVCSYGTLNCLKWIRNKKVMRFENRRCQIEKKMKKINILRLKKRICFVLLLFFGWSFSFPNNKHRFLVFLKVIYIFKKIFFCLFCFVTIHLNLPKLLLEIES